eukprot:COSAG01_NODE_11989_length_1821_cov_6.675958_4_plen_59_part_01
MFGTERQRTLAPNMCDAAQVDEDWARQKESPAYRRMQGNRAKLPANTKKAELLQLLRDH